MKKIVLILVLALLIFSDNLYSQGIWVYQKGKEKSYRILSSPTGRFVFGQISDSSKDQYMLDTWTGRLWHLTESGEVGKFLEPVPYKTKDGKYRPYPEEVIKKKD